METNPETGPLALVPGCIFNYKSKAKIRIYRLLVAQFIFSKEEKRQKRRKVSGQRSAGKTRLFCQQMRNTIILNETGSRTLVLVLSVPKGGGLILFLLFLRRFPL
ncbi:hypothetical protein [Mangrovibacterium diazotrophicum]|uniref:hypothetical protein n=1 Tax=Mangrovibacterium diazotrophicum TaxID=1261403 RepID=UPI000E73107D|nr:hypothetical protein [Mangrovibacterium diazotrophicum]